MIRVYLCTYNGGRYIGEQLESLRLQTCRDFDLLVSDDGSTDETLQVIEGYHDRLGKGLTVQPGPRRGSAANFLTTLAGDTTDADYFAFCDQDDIWQPDKLKRAFTWFDAISDDMPALYGTRVCIVDQANGEIGTTPLPARPLSFANALVQNYAGGNTMVFNRAARALIKESLAGVDIASIPVHDWWVYLIVSGAGGIVYCDDYASLRYRQHGGNVVGARTNRFNALFGRDALDWSERNVQALNRQMKLLTGENRKLLAEFAAARVASLPARIVYALKQDGVYRQTRFGQVGLFLRFMFRRV